MANRLGKCNPTPKQILAPLRAGNSPVDDLGGTAELGAGFDHYVEVRSTPTGQLSLGKS
jgi:hypothetical protein